MSRPPRAHLLVGGVFDVSAFVANRGCVNTERLPENALRTPETPHPESGEFEVVRKRRQVRVLVVEMDPRELHRSPTRCRSVIGRAYALLACLEKHGGSLSVTTHNMVRHRDCSSRVHKFIVS